MVTNHGDRARIDLTLFGTFPDGDFAGLVVERALLPMVIWEGVVVKTRSIQRLSMMERFVIECLLRLRECRTEEFLEIASMPPELTNWLLGSLVHKRLAHCDGGVFRPETDACHQALEQKGIPVEQEEQRGLIWFPETNEILVIKESGDMFRKLSNIHPSGRFPLPEKWQNVKRGEIIHQALRSGHLLGNDVGTIIDVVDDVTLDNETCPTYYFKAMLPHAGIDGWRLAIIGYSRRSQSETNGDNGNANKSELAEESLPLPMLPTRLASLWQGRLSDAHDSICNALRQQFGLIDVQDGDGRLLAIVTKEAAEGISGKWLLVNKLGLGVRIEGEIEYIIPLRLQPSSADQAAQQIFVLDEAVHRVLAIQGDFETVENVCREAGVPLSGVFKRLWQLKQFCKVYELREMEDFT